MEKKREQLKTNRHRYVRSVINNRNDQISLRNRNLCRKRNSPSNMQDEECQTIDLIHFSVKSVKCPKKITDGLFST